MAYAYYDSVLQFQTYYDVSVKNKSLGDWVDFQPSLFFDPDLGAFNDDYVGCDSVNNFAFVYNANYIDGMPGTEGSGYGSNPPMCAIKINSDMPMSSAFYYHNDFTVMGNPETNTHYYNYMNATWKNGTHITKGGTGYGGTIPTNYMFSGNPAVAGDWDECESLNTPSDRRMLINISKYPIISPNQSAFFNFAVIFKPNVGTCPDYSLLLDDCTSADSVLSLAAEVHPVGIAEDNAANFTLSPNPISSNQLLKITSETTITKCKITDSNGRIVYVSQPNKQSVEMPIQVSSGLYIISITNAANQTIHKKIIVQ
jgi:hypothetical protein